jgi:hypothetical protein
MSRASGQKRCLIRRQLRARRFKNAAPHQVIDFRLYIRHNVDHVVGDGPDRHPKRVG